MLRRFLIYLLALLPSGSLSAAEAINFNRDIRPVLANHCFRCHGPDAEAREAALRLDVHEAATAELDSGEGHAIVPGNAAQSQLIARITSDDEDLRMPPADAGPQLSSREVKLLTNWISAGAEYEKHWSLQPVVSPPRTGLPQASSPIDQFLLAKIDDAGLVPNPRADRHSLIRRVSLALTGLPPSIEQVETFVNDNRPHAYEDLVDRLLASPRLGERWAQVWLDIARYADSAGYAQDPERTIWRYRDWVIDAYNANMTFDQFTVEQIAGDLLPEPTNEQLLATAFHRNTMTNSEGGTDDEEFRSAAVVDRTNTTMEVWTGMTMGCAQCHDHKYDPISQAEYFQLYAILNNTDDADRPDESPWLEELTEGQISQKSAIQADLAELANAGDTTKETTEAIEKKRKDLQAKLDNIRGPRTPIMRELPPTERRETFIQVRGNFKVLSDQVEPGVPKALHEINENPNRLDLARWLVANENPLTARVVVNRYWEQIFGRGIVPTSEDFGTQGDLPSHPELLDYLASELMRWQWDTNWLLKQLVLSDAFQRSTKSNRDMTRIDGENRWLARGPRFRMSAEMIRDQALATSGLLSTKIHGPSVHPPRPKLGLRSAFGGSTDWETSKGEDRYRRGLYTSWRRTTPYPSMTTFDAPSREFCAVRRIRTNTPLQALVTLNDPVFVESAQALARMVVQASDEAEERIFHLFRRVLARDPNGREFERIDQLYRDLISRYRHQPEEAKLLAGNPSKSGNEVELAAWTAISNVILNLDETLAPR